MKLESVPIEKINVGDRFREDLGDVEKLSESLAEVGLLQPIGVDKYYSLVFGERRLAAAELLGWRNIDCHVLDIESVLGEYTENEFRKNFTPSERAAIGKAIEAELGNRKGTNQHSSRVGAIAPTLEKGKSVDIAAKRAGFKSRETFERAKTVTDKGAPEVVAAMDRGDLSISAAEVIAKMPKEKQAEVVAMPKQQQRAAVKDAREKEELNRRNGEVVAIRSFEAWVKDVGNFAMDAATFWDAAARHNLIDFGESIKRARNCLDRIEEGHPNETKRPRAVRNR